MKRTTILALMVLTAGISATADNPHMKRYDIRSGKILYEIRGSGNVMGMVQTKTKGKKRVIFDQYGAKEITEVAKITRRTTNGISKIEKLHTMHYINGGVFYTVDFKHKKIVRMQNPALGASAMFGNRKNMAQNGQAMLQKMGGKMIGKDTVLGYSCDVWDLMGVQQCIYKGIVLRIVSDIMGVKNSEVATKIQWNIPLKSSDFRLPKYPITNMGGNGIALEADAREKMDAQETAKRIQQIGEASEAMSAALKAAAASGVSMRGHQQPTPAQKNAISNAMMPFIKKKIIRKKAQLLQDKVCLRNAHSLADANRCSKGRGHPLARWNAQEKAKILHQVDQAIQAMDCSLKADTMQQMEQCRPHH